MVAGALIACLGHCAMLACHHYRTGHLYLLSLTVAVFGMNCCYACYTALLPDFVLPEHMGKASGVMASMTILGSFLGFALFGFYLDVEHSYPLYCAAVLATKPNPSPIPNSNPNPNPNPNPNQVAYPDFFWVFVTRTFYYMGLSIQAFVLFMLRDVQKVADPKYITSMLAMGGRRWG